MLLTLSSVYTVPCTAAAAAATGVVFWVEAVCSAVVGPVVTGDPWPWVRS